MLRILVHLPQLLQGDLVHFETVDQRAAFGLDHKGREQWSCITVCDVLKYLAAER
jgi:hypothetical protein